MSATINAHVGLIASGAGKLGACTLLVPDQGAEGMQVEFVHRTPRGSCRIWNLPKAGRILALAGGFYV